MSNYLYVVFRAIFRLLNRFLYKVGFVLSKPDFIHGSPAFSGSLVFSRRAFQTQEFFQQIADVEGDIFEGSVHWGYGLLLELLLADKNIHAFDSFEGHSNATDFDKESPLWKPLDKSFAVCLQDVMKPYRLDQIFLRRL